jgi:hypothetical protein
MSQAFALRAEYVGTITSADDDGDPVEVERFRGGSLAMPDGSTFDLAEAFGQDGSGVVTTDDPVLAAHLSMFPAVKEVSVPQQDAPAHSGATSLDGMTVKALLDLPESRAIEGAHSMRRGELVARITLARQGADPNVPMEERDGAYVTVEPSEGGDQ